MEEPQNIFPPIDNNKDTSYEATNLISKTLQYTKQQIKIQQESPNDLLPFEQTYRFHISTDYYKCPINSINYDTK